jgi:hypothetical protein
MSASSFHLREDEQSLESQRVGETGVKIHERNGWLRSFFFSIRRIFLGRKVIPTEVSTNYLRNPHSKAEFE